MAFSWILTGLSASMPHSLIGVTGLGLRPDRRGWNEGKWVQLLPHFCPGCFNSTHGKKRNVVQIADLFLPLSGRWRPNWSRSLQCISVLTVWLFSSDNKVWLEMSRSSQQQLISKILIDCHYFWTGYGKRSLQFLEVDQANSRAKQVPQSTLPHITIRIILDTCIFETSFSLTWSKFFFKTPFV